MNPWKVHLFLGLHLTLYVTPRRRSLEQPPLPGCQAPSLHGLRPGYL
jgi:hypothetical protein